MQTKYNGHSRKSGIYQIRNLNNEKVYIGSAKEFKRRFTQHLNSLNKGTHHNKHLQGAFNKHGSDAFVFEVLEVVEGEQSDRLLVEQRRLNSYEESWEACYNFDKKCVASSRSCFSKTPEETRKLISENCKRLWSDPVFKEQTLKKLQEASSTPEARAKLSAGQKAAWDADPLRKKEFTKRSKKRWSDMTAKTKENVLNQSVLSSRSIKKRQATQKKNIIENKKAYLLERYENIGSIVEFWDGKLVPRAKLFENANLISPEGVLYISIRNLNAFAREFGMTHKESWKLQQVIEGSRWEHKGWIKKMSLDELNSWKNYKETSKTARAKSHSNKPYAKVYGSLVSPDGTVYHNVTNVSVFAKQHELCKQSVYSLLLGKAHVHKGWTRYNQMAM